LEKTFFTFAIQSIKALQAKIGHLPPQNIAGEILCLRIVNIGTQLNCTSRWTSKKTTYINMADIDNEWHAGDEYDDDDDDEEDFVPGRDDELEDEYVDEDDNDDDDDEEFPSLLEGELFRDLSKGGNLCYEQEGAFCLVCQDSIPESFQISSPVLDKPFKFAGWIQTPATWYEFEVIFSQRPEPDDPIEVKFLQAQDDLKQSTTGEARMMKVGKSTGEEDEDDDDDDHEAPAKVSQKALPSYDDDGDGKKTAASPGDDANEKKNSSIFALTAKQVGGDNPCDDASRIVTFHGAFRRPKVSDKTTFVICPVNLSVVAGASAAGGSAAPASAAAAPAAGRKRSRSDRDDDESVVEVETGGVLNELIGLHDDAHLSTEQLRAKYYGGAGGARGSGKMDGDFKKPPPQPSKKSTDDDDDDDDIGF
jgi:hypothetical protein